MKHILLCALLVMAAGCSPQASSSTMAESGGIAWMRDLSAAKELAQSENKPILIDFYTEWCGWCKKLDKDTYQNGRVIAQAEAFVCVKIDAEKNQQLAREFNVRGFPSTAFLQPDGSLIEVVPGYLPPDNFLELLERILQSVEA